MTDRVCVVTGVGPGNGVAFARRFASEGYRVAMLARSAEALRGFEGEVPGSVGIPADVTDADAVAAAFGRVRETLGPVDVLLHNAGSGVFGSFADTSPAQFEEAWRINTLGLVVCGQEVIPDMRKAGRGTIVVTGATAALRGGANFAAFASAKAGQRSLAQSMARALGPEGIHVAYVIVDGVIDIPRTRAMFDRPDEFFLKPDQIADTVFHVAHQDPSAWTFEVDLRPFQEKW